MKRTFFASMLVLSALTACSKKEAPKNAAGSASAPGTTVANAPGSASGALAHLPGKGDAVMRIDFAAVVAVPSMKTHLIPALEEMKKAEPKDEAGRQAKAFLADAGIDPVTDVKEVAVCFNELKAGAGEPKFTLVVGGNFKPGSIVPAMEKNGKADRFKIEELEGSKILVDSDGHLFLGQAPDGAVVLSHSKETLAAAFKTSNAAATFQVPTDAAVSFVMPAEFMKTAMGNEGSPFVAQASKVGRGVLALDLKKPDVQLRIAMGDEKSATELAGAVKLILGQALKDVPPPGHPMAPMFAMLQAAKIDSKGSDAVVEIAISTEKLDELSKMLVEAIKGGGPAASEPPVP